LPTRPARRPAARPVTTTERRIVCAPPTARVGSAPRGPRRPSWGAGFALPPVRTTCRTARSRLRRSHCAWRSQVATDSKARYPMPPADANANPVGPPASPRTSRPRPPADASGYAELKRRIKQHGLLEKQPAFLTLKIAINLVLLGISVALMFVSSSLWLQIPNAGLMASIFGQISFVAHDVGHR